VTVDASRVRDESVQQRMKVVPIVRDCLLLFLFAGISGVLALARVYSDEDSPWWLTFFVLVGGATLLLTWPPRIVQSAIAAARALPASSAVEPVTMSALRQVGVLVLPILATGLALVLAPSSAGAALSGALVGLAGRDGYLAARLRLYEMKTGRRLVVARASPWTLRNDVAANGWFYVQ
jgi:hypothetical protein